MPVKIKFLGGVMTVTGSSHLVTNGSSSVLLDAGLFQGHRDEFYRVNTTFNFNVHKLNAILLSHAHIDHSGNIPNVIKKGARWGYCRNDRCARATIGSFRQYPQRNQERGAL